MCKDSGQLPRAAGVPLPLRNSWTTYRKPVISDGYSVLETITWSWRIFGIFPFTVTASKGIKKYEINKFYGIYGFVIFIVCLAYFADGIIHFYDYTRTQDKARIYAPVMIRTILSITCMFISNIIRIFRLKGLHKLIERVVSRETFIEKMGSRLNYENIVKTFQTYLWTSVTIGLILISFDYYVLNLSFKRITLRWLFWAIPLIAQILDLTIFMTLVVLLGSKFHVLNKNIKSIVLRANASPPQVIVTSDVCAENLRLVGKAHYNTCALGKQINRFFEWDVIVSVIASFAILTMILHNIFLEVQRDSKTNHIRIGYYVNWELIHSIPIIAIVVACNWTSSQSIYTGKLIHEIRVEKTDSKLYEAVKTFSLQLHHQKLEFTAAGFFPLNSTLLQAMVANITTYLFILIQFEPRVTWEEDTS